jgi:hypothetical protein
MKTLKKSEIIDIHCHAAGIGAGNSGCSISPALRKSWKFRIYLNAFGVTPAELAQRGDSCIIEKLSTRLAASDLVSFAVVLAMDGVIGNDGHLDRTRTELYVPNEFVSHEVARYNNLLFGASINPYRNDAIERLEKAAEDRAFLIKWLPSVQMIDPADKKLKPFYVRMNELRLPLLIHTGDEHSFTRSHNELADPDRLRLPLEMGVMVIAAHAATNGKNCGVSNFERILPLFRAYPNLFADISSLTQINKIGHLQHVLMHEEIRDRLLYGTDMPLLCAGLVSPFSFVHAIGLKNAFLLQKIQNPWDRDVKLKRALGLPEAVFGRAAGLFPNRA